VYGSVVYSGVCVCMVVCGVVVYMWYGGVVVAVVVLV
jgi:hypothetical protein